MRVFWWCWTWWWWLCCCVCRSRQVDRLRSVQGVDPGRWYDTYVLRHNWLHVRTVYRSYVVGNRCWWQLFLCFVVDIFLKTPKTNDYFVDVYLRTEHCIGWYLNLISSWKIMMRWKLRHNIVFLHRLVGFTALIARIVESKQGHVYRS